MNQKFDELSKKACCDTSVIAVAGRSAEDAAGIINRIVPVIGEFAKEMYLLGYDEAISAVYEKFGLKQGKEDNSND
jgi:hypothetical protein